MDRLKPEGAASAAAAPELPNPKSSPPTANASGSSLLPTFSATFSVRAEIAKVESGRLESSPVSANNARCFSELEMQTKHAVYVAIVLFSIK